jgi:hypothetical protein
MTELTSTSDSGLSITILIPVVLRKGSLLGFFLSVLHHTSFVLSSELSGSLLSSYSLLVSLSLVKTVAGHNCFHELVVVMSLSLYKMSLSLLSNTSECVSARNLQRILSSFRTLYAKPRLQLKEIRQENRQGI